MKMKGVCASNLDAEGEEASKARAKIIFFNRTWEKLWLEQSDFSK